jgi:hypothetical protein
MPIDETLLFGKEKLRLQRLEIREDRLDLFATTAAATAECPICGRVSERVHSSYTRTVSDLPWHGRPVILRLRIRRFFCEYDGCRRVIFAERIPQVAGDYARKTDRLEDALLAVGFALGGEAGCAGSLRNSGSSLALTRCSGVYAVRHYRITPRCGWWAWTIGPSVAVATPAPSW